MRLALGEALTLGSSAGAGDGVELSDGVISGDLVALGRGLTLAVGNTLAPTPGKRRSGEVALAVADGMAAPKGVGVAEDVFSAFLMAGGAVLVDAALD